MSAWTPVETGVQQICYLLAEVQKPGTNQAQILSQLEQCKKFPDFNNYLAFIISQGDSLPVEVRQSAGLLLKNNLKANYATTTDEYRRYVKLALSHAISNPSKPLRHVVGTNIAVIVVAGGLAAWPELLLLVVQCLESSDAAALEGALDALYKICEEAPAQLEVEVPLGGKAERPSNLLVPRLLALFGSSVEDAKCLAVSILNLLAGGMPKALADNMETYMTGLFKLAHDPSSAARKGVCTGLVQLLHLQPDRLAPHLPDIIEYMLRSMQESDEGVALESCEFWSAFCEASVEPEVLRPYLPRLVPALMRNMMYGEFDEEVLAAESAEEELAGAAGAAAAVSLVVGTDPSDKDLKPFHARSGGRHEDDTDDDDGEEVSRWNLRKCSAAGLDVLATVFAGELLPITLPIINERLREDDWRARESAILALGAISEGCAAGLLTHLAEMVSVLLPKLGDARPLVRSITCWSLSRYARWLVQAAREAGAVGVAQFDSVLAGLLGRVRDHNRQVQEAACSALATLEEAAGGVLVPRLPAILDTLAGAVLAYSRRNLRLLYDSLSTLADAVGPALAEPAALRTIMPPLVLKWQALGDTDRELLPLLECLTSLAQALGPAFEPYAEAMYERCMRIVAMQLQAREAVAAGAAALIEPEREFIICALDLVSGLAEGLGVGLEALVGRSMLRPLLVQCCQDPSADVRQSAFALVGDLSKACQPHLAPIAGDLIALGVASLQPAMIRQDTMSACNNACWALGELAVKSAPEELGPYALAVVERLVPILSAPVGSMPRSIIENSAITLGRVAWICPAALAPHLGHFCAAWCGALRSIRDDVEKEHAFLGLAALLRLNPEAALDAWSELCEALASWRHIRCEGLLNELTQLLHLYKANLASAGRWEQFMALLQPAVYEKLSRMFGI